MKLRPWPSPFNVDVVSAIGAMALGAFVAWDPTNYRDAIAYDFLDAIPSWLFAALLMLAAGAQFASLLFDEHWARRGLAVGFVIFWAGMTNGVHSHDPHAYTAAWYIVMVLSNALTMVGL